MSGRTWSVAALAATMVVLGSGCIIVGSSGVDEYQSCTPGSTVCRGLATCRQANAMAGMTAAGTFCTEACTTAASCPADLLTGQPADCVIIAPATTGQCYRRCETAPSSCPLGHICAAYAPGLVNQICVPTGGGTVCGGLGQACCAGNSCTASGATCTAGTCTAAPPCGRVGNPCCAGRTCTDPGSACAMDATATGTCLLAPYSACAVASLGSPCASGVNAASQVVPTTCQRAMSMGSANTFCTATCTAAMSECPAVPSGEMRYNCYRIAGATTGQCFQDCNLGMACPPGTTCRSVMPVGVMGAVQICMP